MLFVLLAVAFEASLPAEPHVPLTALPLFAHVLAGLFVYAFLLGLFGYVVLPRFGPGENHERVRHDWTLSAGVYVAALLVLVPVVTTLV